MKDKIFKRKRIEMTKAGIMEAFKELRWSFRFKGISYWQLMTPDGADTGLEFNLPDTNPPYCVRQDYKNWRGGLSMLLKDCYFQWLGDDTITLRVRKNPNVFINFHDFKAIGVSKVDNGTQKDITQ